MYSKTAEYFEMLWCLDETVGVEHFVTHAPELTGRKCLFKRDFVAPICASLLVFSEIMHHV